MPFKASALPFPVTVIAGMVSRALAGGAGFIDVLALGSGILRCIPVDLFLTLTNRAGLFAFALAKSAG